MQRDVGTDVKILDRMDIASRAISGIRDEPVGTELAAKQGASQLIEQDLAL